jgi:diguanylate cyclase (GGDEF)-like protein
MERRSGAGASQGEDPVPNSIAQVLEQERERLLLTLSARLKAELESRQRRGIPVSDLMGELPRIYSLVCQALNNGRQEKAKGKISTAAPQHGVRRAEQGFDVGVLFHEFNLLRTLIEEVIRQRAGGLTKEQLLNAQTRLSATLEHLLYLAVNTHIHRHVQELSDQARRDPLTGLLNRATFDSCLSDEVDRASRYNRGLSLVLLDVDRFKSVNDRLGHQAGDQVLVSIARILHSSLRHSDTAFRYGGDEFAAICPETGGNVMEGVMRRLEASVLQEVRIAEQIGISWGIASFPTDASEAKDLIRIADERLYICKKEHHQRGARSASPNGPRAAAAPAEDQPEKERLTRKPRSKRAASQTS